MEFRGCAGTLESLGQIKTLDTGMKIGRIQANNLRILSGRLWQQVLVRRDQIRELHALLVGITAWSKHVSLQVNRVLVVRRDREDMNDIAVVDQERIKL